MENSISLFPSWYNKKQSSSQISLGIDYLVFKYFFRYNEWHFLSVYFSLLLTDSGKKDKITGQGKLAT